MRPEIESSSTPMKRMAAGAMLMKLPMPQPGSSTVADGNAQAGQGLVHGGNDGR